MRKNTKRLLLGLVAVAILGGVYAGLMHMPDEQDTSSESKTLVSADADALSSIHVALSGGDDYTLTSTTKNKKTTYTMSGTDEETLTARCGESSAEVTFVYTALPVSFDGVVDAKDGYVAIHGWKEVSREPGVDFCRRLAAAGCTAIIYTDIACDGAMKGTNLGLYRQLAEEVPGVAFTASGGISSEAELLELKKMGTAAAILGKSLYTGALDLARCVQLVQE